MKNRLGKVFKVMLLTLTLVLMYSINVSAASGQASIGSKNYATVQKALTAVKNGQTIKLNQDITVTKTLVSKKNVTYTFDMNKHKIISKVADENDGTFDIIAGKVTILNGTLNGTIFTEKGATLTVNGGTYQQIINSGKTVVNNGKIVNKKYSAFCNYGGSLVIKKATVKARYNCVYGEKGTVTINGGTFGNYDRTCNYPVIYSEKATINLKGGTYADSYIQKVVGIVYNNKGKVTISGGKYMGDCGAIMNYSSMTIKGGTFTSENSYVLYCGANSTTSITGGKFIGGAYGSVIEVGSPRKKFSMTGGSIDVRMKGSAVVCYNNKNNFTLDTKKVKITGDRWENVSVRYIG